MEEIWKDIDGYEGLYRISNFGNVLSLNYRKHGYAKLLTPKKSNSGRLWVELIKDGKKKQMLIHRLVGMAFIPNPDNLPQINHKDENPKNNRVDNLEWCTYHYNMLYTISRHPEKYPYASGAVTRKKPEKERKIGKRMGFKINQYSMDGEFIKQWENSRTIFLLTGMSDWSISECCRGKRQKAYGFKWRYAV